MNPLNNFEKINVTQISNLNTNKIDNNNNNNFLSIVEKNKKNLEEKFLELKENNSILNQLIELLKGLGFFDFTDKSSLKYKEDYQAHFKVDKKEEKLKFISVIYKGFNLVNLEVKFLNEEKSLDYFTPKNTNCTFLNITNNSNVTLY